jgi:hypothetical protein
LNSGHDWFSYDLNFVLRYFIAKDFALGWPGSDDPPCFGCMLESLPFRDRVHSRPAWIYSAGTNDLATKQSSGATQQIPDTLPRPQMKGEPDTSADVIVIGAGPTGLACAIEAQRAGFRVMAIDKGCVVNSIFHYPANMSFFTTPELLEIGDIPSAPPGRSPRAKKRWNTTVR